MSRTLAAVALALAATAFAAGPAAATETVDDDKKQCPSAQHTKIQAGVDAASPGELVLVCNGVYREAVNISGPSKDRIRVVANATHFATIMLSDDVAGPMVQISGSENVQLRRFRINGDNCCGTVPHAAVALDDATGAKISENLITQDDDESGAFFFGVRAFGSSRLIIIDNRIEEYESVGVGIDDGSRHLVTRNTITASPTLFEEETAQSGVAFGGQVEITANRISGNRSNRADVRGTGIQDNSGFLGVTGNTISGNRVFENDVGLALSSTGALIKSNFVFDNDEQGILLSKDATGNKIERNDARDNGGLDCEDRTAGSNPGQPGFPVYTTSNRWVNNKGLDASPPPICTPSGAAGPPVG